VTYRAEVDGLRALAVIPVVLFHAGFRAFSGGFVGVDVFFVLSGYLITGIIHSEIRAGSFSIVNFYERRARRILPALLFVCGLSIVPAWLWMMPAAFAEFARSLAAVTVFGSNVLFFRETGYFAHAVEFKPLLHTWSLGVEEQFYLVFPVVLIALGRLGRQALFGVLLVVTALSLGLSEWSSRVHPAANFYLLPTRVWELGTGALLALLAFRAGPRSRLTAETGAACGLAMIVYAIVVFDGTVRIPGLIGLIPVAGTALVIAFATPATAVGRMLAWKPLVGIGLISYSAYLWHQPLFAFARIRSLDGVSTNAFLGLSVVTFVLAYFSWRFVEQPFRARRLFSRRQVFVGGAAASAVLLAFAGASVFANGFPGRVVPAAAAMAAWGGERGSRFIECSFRPGKPFETSGVCRHGSASPSAPVIALWGDSHAEAIAAGLADEVGRAGIALTQYTSRSCVPVRGYEWAHEQWNCRKETEAIFAAIVAEPALRTVVLASRWAFFFEGRRFDNQEGGIESGEPNVPVVDGFPEAPASDPAHQRRLGELMGRTVHDLLAAGKDVVLVYPVPEAGWDVPYYLAREIQFGIRRERPLSTRLDVFLSRTREARAALDRIGDNPHLFRVRPSDMLCGTVLEDRCVVQQGNAPLYFDDDHLSSVGASLVARGIAGVLDPVRHRNVNRRP
jgi:peptidoglycan/LPS O-acetylase OafA/YrhL